MIIGSTAARELVPGWREPKDVDLFTPDPKAGQLWPDSKVETFWHPLFNGWIPPGPSVAPLDTLYTIKVSHSYWDLGFGSWDKHIRDAAALKRAGATLDLALHSMLYEVWTEKHGSKKMSLAQDAGDFFDDAVIRKYDHDSIHRSVAKYDRPLYEYALKPGATVDMDMALVRTWPVEQTLDLFREEVYATALERILIPKDYRHSPRAAYQWALKRTVTSLTRGWSARFIVEHYDELSKPADDYVSRHQANSDVLIPL